MKVTWYPDRRGWDVVSAEHAQAFAEAIAKAAEGEPSCPPPDWLVEAERESYHRLLKAEDLGQSPHLIDQARRRWLRMAGETPQR